MKTKRNTPDPNRGATGFGAVVAMWAIALTLAFAFAMPVVPATAADNDADADAVGEPGAGLGSIALPELEDRGALEEALKKLELPGVTINLDERSVDLDSIVVLREGTLELIACRVGTKEHESIVAVKARPMHIHTALLLLGAPAGNPATWKRAGGDHDGLWMHVPPRGGKVDVSLVIEDEDGEPVERPISDFIAPRRTLIGEADDQESERFPTNTFLFAGSHLQTDDSGQRHYLSDRSGNVITVVAFGDEVLCLPLAESADNSALMWEVDPTHLPPLETEVVLRLRPRVGEEAEVVEGETGETLEDAAAPPAAAPGAPAP